MPSIEYAHAFVTSCFPRAFPQELFLETPYRHGAVDTFPDTQCHKHSWPERLESLRPKPGKEATLVGQRTHIGDDPKVVCRVCLNWIGDDSLSRLNTISDIPDIFIGKMVTVMRDRQESRIKTLQPKCKL